MEGRRQRLARLLQQRLGLSFSRAKEEVRRGHVTVNEAVELDPGAWVAPTDRVEHRPDLPRRRPAPAAPPIEVVFFDQHLVVVNKPAGVLVHPTVEEEQDTVLTRTLAALARRAAEGGRLFVVHRLDRETSGVMVLARSHAAAERLHRQFRAHTVARTYLALVAGDLVREVTVRRSIGRPRPTARRAALAPGRGKEAVTHFTPVERLGAATLVEACPETGRTHQVRVHLAYLGHPVLGDPLYGGAATQPNAVPRLALHAKQLTFTHPVDGRRLEFAVPLPADLAGPLRRLRIRHRRRVTAASTVTPAPGRALAGTATATRQLPPRTPPPPAATPEPRPVREPSRRPPRTPRRPS